MKFFFLNQNFYSAENSRFSALPNEGQIPCKNVQILRKQYAEFVIANWTQMAQIPWKFWAQKKDSYISLKGWHYCFDSVFILFLFYFYFFSSVFMLLLYCLYSVFILFLFCFYSVFILEWYSAKDWRNKNDNSVLGGTTG